MPEEMRVGVDPAGRDGETLEIVNDGVRWCGATDAGDFSSFNNDDGVGESTAFSIEYSRGG